MEYWVVDFDVDGFRLDVADGIPLDFWKEARRRLDSIRPGLILLAEGTRNQDQLEVMDLNYGFAFFGALDSVLTKGAPVQEIRKNWEAVVAKNPKGVRFTRYTDNHDVANDDYSNRREKRWGNDLAQTALALCLTMDGTPMLYNGQEIADDARHSIFGRALIDQSKENTEYGQKRFLFLQNLIKLRREHSALTSNKLKWLDVDISEKAIAFLRTSDNEKIICVFNLRNEIAKGRVDTTQEDINELEPLVANGSLGLSSSQIEFELPPFGFCVAIVK